MEISNRSFPQYEIRFLDVGDADCIIIRYKRDSVSPEAVAVVDAGNVSDGGKVKSFLRDHCKTNCIDLAVCTHPDGDHKGGFFGLLKDDDIIIREFWLKDIARYVSDEEFTRMKKMENKLAACRCAYNHPSDDSVNLIDLIIKKKNKDGSNCDGIDVRPGSQHKYIPISVRGPDDGYYQKVALEIIQKVAEIKSEPDTEKYDEKFEVSEEDAKSIIDGAHDESPTNKGSLVLYFAPTPKFKVLLAGDASETSLGMVVKSNKDIVNCVLKVPHHGSKHNLNSALIDELRPSASIISAAGTKEHPHAAVVRYLSRYGNVYSTHKSGDLWYRDQPPVIGATPLKEKFRIA